MVIIYEKEDEENQPLPSDDQLPPEDSGPIPATPPAVSTSTNESKRYYSFRRYLRRILRRCRRLLLFVLCTFIIGYTLVAKVIPVLYNEYHRYQDDCVIHGPAGRAVDRCADWKSSPGATEEFFVNMDSLLFLAQGSLATGEIIVKQSENATWGGQAKVTVRASTQFPRFFDYVWVCQIRSKHAWIKDTGVGIFHTFGNLSRIHFDEIKISTKKRPIISEIFTQFISADDVTFQTSNAPIKGTYNVSSGVSLTTSRSFIDVEMQLHRREPTPADGRLPKLWTTSTLRTSRGHIRATYDLHTSTPVKNYSRYLIEAETTLGKIDIDFVDAPPVHVLSLHAATTFRHARVSVPPQFEGSFTMRSLYPFRKIVDERENYDIDPLGRNRSRNLWQNYEDPFVRKGAVVWGRADALQGEIDLKSTLGSTAIVI
ncbi:hypothetical protein EST38_g151 [Candolleomyces aberdarensis]|uniref:Uncharacterized protein n=1 Tax=Candolleomyces aberdarensis TaxID=2316362 RepID=A0A4Q2DZE5_9AGAR|nr:hypothetical protein EST38_g151 [Candolleomyces aberdarensis]